MSYKANFLSITIFTLLLIISSNGLQRNLRKSFSLHQQNKCFQFDLKKRSAPIQSSLNLINLLSYHKALSQKEKTFVSFHQKKETNLITKKKLIIDEEHNKTNSNSSYISVYMKNKYNAEV